MDKRISDLPQADQINDDDLFVLEQNGEAKSITGGEIGAADLFIVKLSVLTDSTIAADKSATEIEEANIAGKLCFVVIPGGGQFPLFSISHSTVHGTRADFEKNTASLDGTLKNITVTVTDTEINGLFECEYDTREIRAAAVGAMPDVPVTAADEGKVLMVVNGVWTAVSPTQ